MNDFELRFHSNEDEVFMREDSGGRWKNCNNVMKEDYSDLQTQIISFPYFRGDFQPTVDTFFPSLLFLLLQVPMYQAR
jgi:hypothetical protein